MYRWLCLVSHRPHAAQSGIDGSPDRTVVRSRRLPRPNCLLDSPLPRRTQLAINTSTHPPEDRRDIAAAYSQDDPAVRTTEVLANQPSIVEWFITHSKPLPGDSDVTKTGVHEAVRQREDAAKAAEKSGIDMAAGAQSTVFDTDWWLLR